MCHGSDLCERFFRDLTKGVETSSPVCFSDECMGAGCVCCKWKAPHLCLYGTQICLIKSGGNPSHCLSSWNKYAPIHYHHRQLATLHRLFFFFFFLFTSSEGLSVLPISTPLPVTHLLASQSSLQDFCIFHRESREDVFGLTVFFWMPIPCAMWASPWVTPIYQVSVWLCFLFWEDNL